MRLSFTPDQIMLQTAFGEMFAEEASPVRARAARDNPSGWDDALWRRIADLGWLGVTIDEAYGGMGLHPVSLCLIAEASGRSFAAIPFATSALGFSEALRRAGSGVEPALMRALVAGEARGAIALRHEANSAIVPDSAAVTHVLALAGGRLVASPVVAREFDGDPLDVINPAGRVTFDVAAGSIIAGEERSASIWRDVIAHAAILMAFHQVGAAAATLDEACAHVRTRYAFGRPLGAFQAVKHQLADIYARLEVARSNAWRAAATLDHSGAELEMAAAAARVSATRAAREAASCLLHVLGAIGATAESTAHWRYRKAQALAVTLGSSDAWRDTFIAHALDLAA